MADLFDNNNTAKFSDDKSCRYVLTRIWDNSRPMLMFVGLNPSTATATENDPTISKVRKIASNNGYGGLYMLNLFAFITPYPEALERFYLECRYNNEDIATNNQVIYDYALKSASVVCCWGNFKEAEKRSLEVIKILKEAGSFLCCLKINKNGSPKHPLYCKDQSQLLNYD